MSRRGGPPRPTLRPRSDAAPIAPRKSLGQHFLHDRAMLARIAALAEPALGSGIVEIGPGPGALTEALCVHGARIVAIERDDRMPALLAERFGDAVTVVHDDALAVDWPALLRRPELGPAPVVVGNLPYNIGAAIVMRVLEQGPAVARLVVMLQREVADRMCAPPASRAFGLLSAHTQWRAEVRLALRVPPGAFFPPPKVDSAVVVLTPRARPPFEVPSVAGLDALLDAGFAQRRKTLARALHNGLGLDPKVVAAALIAAGLEADARAERVDLAAWAALARTLDAALAPALARGAGRARRHGASR